MKSTPGEKARNFPPFIQKRMYYIIQAEVDSELLFLTVSYLAAGTQTQHHTGTRPTGDSINKRPNNTH